MERSVSMVWEPQIRADNTVRRPHGGAARSLIHERDIVAVAVQALTGEGHVGATYLLTGAQAVTQAEQVRLIGEAISRPLRFEEMSPDAARRHMSAYLPPSIVEGILKAYAGDFR